MPGWTRHNREGTGWMPPYVQLTRVIDSNADFCLNLETFLGRARLMAEPMNQRLTGWPFLASSSQRSTCWPHLQSSSIRPTHCFVMCFVLGCVLSPPLFCDWLFPLCVVVVISCSVLPHLLHCIFTPLCFFVSSCFATWAIPRRLIFVLVSWLDPAFVFVFRLFCWILTLSIILDLSVYHSHKSFLLHLYPSQSVCTLMLHRHEILYKSIGIFCIYLQLNTLVYTYNVFHYLVWETKGHKGLVVSTFEPPGLGIQFPPLPCWGCMWNCFPFQVTSMAADYNSQNSEKPTNIATMDSNSQVTHSLSHPHSPDY